MVKTLWKTACTAVCLCALIISMTGCLQASDSGDEPFFPDETPAEFSTIRIQVTDSIGGTVVSGTTLKVYKSETTEQIGSGYTVTDGKVMLYDIATDQRYDFELIGEKEKWAGSRLENWKPLSIAKQNLSLIQPVHGTITRGITPPKIKSAQSGNGTLRDIDENTVISASDKVHIVFESAVGAVEETDFGAFGAKLGIGKAPNQMSGINGSCAVSKIGSEFTSTYTFNLEEVPDRKDTLIVVGYDIANNRIEKHIPVTFSASAAPASDLSTCEFENLVVIAERLPYSENLYSLKPVGGRRSSYRMSVRFAFTKFGSHEKILGFDLYRREKGRPQDFLFVSRTLYDDLKTETYSGKGFHVGIDGDSLLEENKEYEYKIRAFNAKSEKYSPVITTKLLESFTYELTSPANNVLVTPANAANFTYKCKISNTNMFRSAQSDYMRFGLLINDWQGMPRFGAKLLYFFDYGGRPEILIKVCNPTTGKLQTKPVRVSDLITAGILRRYGVRSLDDLVKADKRTGIIEFTEKFVRVPFFNVVSFDGTNGLNSPMSYEKGTSYQWDIQDWGNNFALLNDDTALCFVKKYAYTDENGNEGFCSAVSYGNNDANGANAVNGRFTFTVGN
ncbi:dentilisin complex subunit PrcA [Treponema socranskii]|uniref:dentilisin complex subunit PrcA n=1 Tax=Treponema socranskii TaxID=53419 RepID=UPI003D8C2E7A